MSKEKSTAKPSTGSRQLANANELPMHIAIYAGGMDSDAEEFLNWCLMPAGEEAHCMVILATRGGKANVAYRLSRALQRKYKEVHIAIPWICKSAGTLLCIGAHALIFGRRGELGPLDIQVPQKDELLGVSSGLTPLHALSTLRDESFACFYKYFISMLEIGRGQISTTRAAQISTNLTVELLGNIYSQVDPIQLGQTSRDMRIAKEYGERLDVVAKNLKPDALHKLLMEYPEHGFVIDVEEAKELFVRVLPISETTEKIVAHYLPKIKNALVAGDNFFCVIKDNKIGLEVSNEKNGEDSGSERNNNATQEKQPTTVEYDNTV